MKFIPGQIVKIDHLSKDSFYLYKKFLSYSNKMICPCQLNRNKLMIVDEHFDNDIVLVKTLDGKAITVIWSRDLISVYEASDESK